jgi:hypothetical protein
MTRVRVGLLLLAACSAAPGEPDAASGDVPITGITIVSPAPMADALSELAALTPLPSLTVEVAPVKPRDDRYTFEVLVELECVECFHITQLDARTWQVRAGDLLGAQYGVAAMLEATGVRFRHPFDTYVPAELALDETAVPRCSCTPCTRSRATSPCGKAIARQRGGSSTGS